MTIYVRRNGELVDKKTGEPMVFDPLAVGLCAPRISRFECFNSPIDDKPISSWRQRDRDMAAHDCFDPRDLKPDHHWKRGRKVQLEELRAQDGRRSEHPDDAE